MERHCQFWEPLLQKENKGKDFLGISPKMTSASVFVCSGWRPRPFLRSGWWLVGLPVAVAVDVARSVLNVAELNRWRGRLTAF